jgi:hypothetical protein
MSLPPAADNFPYREALARAKSKSEVFVVLGQILDAYGGAARVDRIEPNNLNLEFATASETDTNSVLHMQRWLSLFRDDRGDLQWIWFCFDTKGQLRRMDGNSSTAQGWPARDKSSRSESTP